jgi:hypothetical protein
MQGGGHGYGIYGTTRINKNIITIKTNITNQKQHPEGHQLHHHTKKSPGLCQLDGCPPVISPPFSSLCFFCCLAFAPLFYILLAVLATTIPHHSRHLLLYLILL